jgi:hypothetical protein
VKTEGDNIERVKNDEEEETAEDSDEDMSSSSDVEVVEEISSERIKLIDSIGMCPGFGIMQCGFIITPPPPFAVRHEEVIAQHFKNITQKYLCSYDRMAGCS